VNLGDAYWPQLAARHRGALLVPLGALEQHGPHLPLDTDTRIALAVARGAAAKRAGSAVAPALAFGASDEHRGFPGTLSTGSEALRSLLVALARDGCRDWRAVLFVNAHGGNADALRGALAQLAGEGRPCAAYTAAPAGGDLHAGLCETSLMLHLAPRAVCLQRLQAGNTRPWAQLGPLLRSRGVRAVSPNGVLGDPAAASAALGRRLLAGLIDDCVAALDGLLAAEADARTRGARAAGGGAETLTTTQGRGAGR